MAPAIEKNVLMTSNIYKLALMKQLFKLGCGYSAEILSLTKLMGQGCRQRDHVGFVFRDFRPVCIADGIAKVCQ